MEGLSAELPAKYNHAIGRYGELLTPVMYAVLPLVYLQLTILVCF